MTRSAPTDFAPQPEALADFGPDIAAVKAIDAIPTILDVVTQITGMRFAAIARVTNERWVCLAARDDIGFGLRPGGELKLETTLCHEVRQRRGAVVIDHVAEDALYCKHHTPATYGFQSYISMPFFLRDGSFYGTLCAIDPKPARLKETGVIGMFRLFADLVAAHLDVTMQLAHAEKSLVDAEAAAVLREQFIAVLGHDLRNPLAAIDAGTRLLQQAPLDDQARSVTGIMQKCVARMTALLDDVMDFARGHLGSGILLARGSKSIEPTLVHVIDELRAANPDRVIEVDLDISSSVNVDRERIARLLSNLLSNALAYGARDAPVRVYAATNEHFEISVGNSGAPIPPSVLSRLFTPFTRGDNRSNQKGLGLGLYIVSEIARAHGGAVNVTSTEEETRFTFRMPL